MTPDQYCAARVHRVGSSLHYSLLFLTATRRRAADAVYAFVDEVREIADECHDPGVALTKFEWWREEIERLYRGEPRHPVTQALAPLIAAHGLKPEPFLATLADATRHAGRVRYPNFDLLHDHCLRAGGAAALLAARAFGPIQADTSTAVELLGAALRLSEIVCRLGQDIRRDRLYLPTEDLVRFHVDEQDLLACRHTPAIEQLVSFEIERALHALDDALARLPAAERRAQLPGIIRARLAQAQLDEVRRDGCRVLAHYVQLTPLRKLWIAWRTRLAEGAGA